MVPSESHENGQANEEEEMETAEDESQHRASGDERKTSVCEEAAEAQTPVKHEGEAEKGEQPRRDAPPRETRTSRSPVL